MPDVREFQSVVEEAEQAARAGDFAMADRRLRDALRLQEASLGVDHPELASTLNNLAVVCETLSRFDDAERFYRRAYAIASGALPPGDPLVVTSRDNLKDFCAARGLPLEDWPGIGEFEAPDTASPAAAPPPPARSATAPAAPVAPDAPDARTAPATPPAGPWSGRVIAAVVALAAVGLIVVATSWQSTVPPARPPEPRPAAAPTPPPSTDARPVAPAPVAPAAPPATPAAVVKPLEPPAVAEAPPASPAVAAPPAGVRVVVAEVCRSLTTSRAWRCEPLGASAAPGRAAFYTRIASPRPLRVEHRWYQGTALRQRVVLSVGASPAEGYRTFSRQTLSAGAWRVELRAADGTVLHEAAVDVR